MSYTGMKQPHSVKNIEKNGELLELEDGSRWQVYEGFAFRTSGWSAGEMINVKQGKNPAFPYTLVNVHKNEQVEVSFLEGNE